MRPDPDFESGADCGAGKPEDLERGLKDRQEIVVRISDSGILRDGDEITSLDRIFLAIPGVLSVSKSEAEGSIVTYLLQTILDQDLRAEISKRIVEAGYPLLELAARRLSLEDIFMKLVISEEAVGV